MTLSEESEQGRNASSLNLSDALGAGLFVGVSGTIFAALHDSGNLALTFGAVLMAMAVVGLLAVLISLRIGPVRERVRPALSQRPNLGHAAPSRWRGNRRQPLDSGECLPALS